VIARREVITLIGGAAAVWPLAARAQQRAMRVVGYVHTAVPPEHVKRAFVHGLSEASFTMAVFAIKGGAALRASLIRASLSAVVPAVAAAA
jgi:hypothetical protein